MLSVTCHMQMLNVIMLSVVMLNVIMPSVIMLNVVALLSLSRKGKGVMLAIFKFIF